MLAPEFLPVWGGVGTYIVELVRHLPTKIEVHVVTPLREGFGKERVSTSDYDFSDYFGSNVHVHFVSRANDTFFYNAQFQYACLKTVPKLIKEEKIDLVHSHTAHMPDLLLQFTKFKTPIVTTIHTTIQGQREGTRSSGMSFSDLELSEKITYLTYPFLNFAETLYFSKKRSYITVSNWMKHQIIKLHPKLNRSAFFVIHNSVDTERFSPSRTVSPERDIILFTGRLIAAKGINYLVEAMPRVLRSHPDARFVFIGTGNSSPYQKRLSKMGIPRDSFEFLGYLKNGSDLVNHYRASTVYVAPTLYENLPIRVLEAMACGVPVVASKVCAIPEVIDNGVTGILTQPGSVDQLADAINQLLGDSKMRRRIGENARKIVQEKFNWDINTFKTAQVYRELTTPDTLEN